MNAVQLRRDGDGGYTAAGERFTVQPVMMGDGPRNKGHREWRIVDTTGAPTFSGRDSLIVPALWNARDAIMFVVSA